MKHIKQEQTQLSEEPEEPKITVITEQERLHLLFTEEVARWFADKGDLTHRINYDDLNENSIVLDLGGYEGEWVSNIYSKYNCNVKVYEPIKEYYEYIKSRFFRNDKIEAFNFAFSNVDKDEILCIRNNASSVYMDFRTADRLEIIKVVDFNKYMDSFKHVDLVKINIEGSEYDLLEGLSDENLKKFKNIQVQFHTFVPNCDERRNAIRDRLANIHICTYKYDFVWENWKLR